jgi:hypothetical protein
MTNSVQSLQVAQAHSQKEQSVQPPRTSQEQAAKQNTPASQDQVTISQQARQALVNSTNQ